MTMQELKSIRIHRQRIRELDEDIETLKSEMEKITPSMSEAPCKPTGGDKRAGQIARLADLETEREERYALLEGAIDRVETWLYTLPEQQARVMRARYVDCMSWERVSRATGYKKTHCRYICESAMKKCS
jgi:DNA-directed RNA polymerase specialized sigma24 family protein